MPSITVKISRSANIDAVFEKLPDAVATRIKRGALRAGAKALKPFVVASAPRGDSGDLKRSVRHGVDRYKGEAGFGDVYGYVRAGGRKEAATAKAKAKSSQDNDSGKKRKSAKDYYVYYAHWIEYGTKAHVIPHPRVRYLKQKQANGKWMIPPDRKARQKGIRNPRARMRVNGNWRTGPFNVKGATPNPFMKRAFANGRMATLNAVGAYIDKSLGSALTGKIIATEYE